MAIVRWTARWCMAIAAAVLLALAWCPPNASAQVSSERKPRLLQYEQGIILTCGVTSYAHLHNCSTTLSYIANGANVNDITCVMSGTQSSRIPATAMMWIYGNGVVQVKVNQPTKTVNDAFGGHEHLFVFKGPVSGQTVAISISDWEGGLPNRAFCRVSGIELPLVPPSPLVK